MERFGDSEHFLFNTFLSSNYLSVKFKKLNEREVCFDFADSWLEIRVLMSKIFKK